MLVQQVTIEGQMRFQILGSHLLGLSPIVIEANLDWSCLGLPEEHEHYLGDPKNHGLQY